MKIKTDIDFTSFSDGICNIFTLDENGERVANKHNNLGFENRALGFKRYFEASARQIDIKRVIRIPQLMGIDNYDFVEISNGIDNVIYGVKMVQPIYDSNPLSIDLTLDKANI
ncbi:hypothetical protein [Clostridium estertheticum]|uniref:Uncharacterized protein n=1 Tax=Clostridium estertheticum TaxID=238834 RepID=A0AA47EIM4_9CLOT|nr:hypothetical protein [Clostridium estertheticum]MBU3153500.1 hypothetical protein [Clostridium estertheticum]WAG60902.1 hypothetical protein LL038_01220 [Clostridium estertheticum]